MTLLALSLRSAACALRRLCAPPLVLLLCCLMASLFLYVSPAAFAGTWTLTRTSSSCSQTVNGVNSPGSYPPQKGTPGPSITLPAFNVGAPASNTPGTTEACSGTLTVTVTGTWNSAGANDPVPNTIVTIQTQAGSSGTGQQPLSQTSDDGYKDPMGGANSSGTHYKLETSSPFTITVSPKASISATATATATAMASAAMGGITMTASVPAVSLGGTMPVSGVQYALTGQQITATLGGVPSVSSYTWSGQSATCFKTYNPNIQPPANNQLAPLASTDLTGPASGSTAVTPLAFYDSAAENLTVSCAATVTNPDGTTFNVTAASPQIMVKKPSVSAWGINTGTGPQQGVPSGSVQAGVSTNAQGNSSYNLYADEVWGPITITVPPPFPSGSGLGCIAQIITADSDSATRVPIGTAPVTYVDVVKNASGQYVAPSTPALDSAFPFPIGYNLGTNGVINLVMA